MSSPADERHELPQPGDLLDGRYRVREVLGAGGMGTVLAARHEQMGHDVAIKVMAVSAARDRKKVERFKREAWAAAKIKNDHVARVLNVGELDHGVPFMVLELLDGRDLFEVIQSRLLSVSEAVDFVLQACEALAEAHAEGIIHRDLKPSNLFLTHRPDGKPWIKVLDFGISKHASSAMQLTKTRSLMGSPLYMAPEQMASSKSVDPRCDVWSLGVILYELVSGHTPFEGETLPEICTRVLHSPPTPLREHASVPEGFERTLGSFLAKRPEERLQHLGQVVDALEPWGTAESAASAAYVRSVLGHARAGPAAASTTLVHGGVSSPVVEPRTMEIAPAPRPSLPMVTALHDDDEDDEPTNIAARPSATNMQAAPRGSWPGGGTWESGSWPGTGPPPTGSNPSWSGRSGVAPSAIPTGASTHTTMTTDEAGTGGRRGLLGLGVLLLLLLTVGGGLWVGRDQTAEPAASPAPPGDAEPEQPEPRSDASSAASSAPASAPVTASASASASASSAAVTPRPSPPPVAPRPVRPPPPPRKGWDPFEGR